MFHAQIRNDARQSLQNFVKSVRHSLRDEVGIPICMYTLGHTHVHLFGETVVGIVRNYMKKKSQKFLYHTHTHTHTHMRIHCIHTLPGRKIIG
jgi:hypothetical protein